MSAIQRGLYVTIGAADFAAEKVREIPGVAKFVEESKKFGEKSVLDHAREIEDVIGRATTEERRVSEERRRLHEVIDTLEAELANRYRAGLAPPV